MRKRISKIKSHRQKVSPLNIIFDFDKSFFYLIVVLLIVGLVFVADISAPQALNYFNDKFFFLKQQIIWAIIGFMAMIVVSKIHYSFWKKLAVPMFVFSVISLLVVLLPGVGLKALGARRWIVLGPFNFQPSEVVKLSLALFLAKTADSDKKPLAYFVPLALVCGLIMLQPDLGTTLVVGVIGVVQIFVSQVSLVYFIGSLVAGFLSVGLLILLSPYRRDRLMTFIGSASDPLGKEYHIRQILLSLGSGGLLGVGLGQSRQKYLFLPEAATDSIFAAIAEEIGFVGSLLIIVLLGFFVWKAFKIATKAPDKFSKVLTVGLSAWIGGQILLNISSMTALTPLTGIPLPFFSYGGTSLSMILAACGILLNISKYGTQKNIISR